MTVFGARTPLAHAPAPAPIASEHDSTTAATALIARETTNPHSARILAPSTGTHIYTR